MQANSDELSYLQGVATHSHLTMTYFERSKVNIKFIYDFDVENIRIVITWCMEILRSYHSHNAAWPAASLKVQKGYTKVNVKIFRDVDVENIPIKL